MSNTQMPASHNLATELFFSFHSAMDSNKEIKSAALPACLCAWPAAGLDIFPIYLMWSGPQDHCLEQYRQTDCWISLDAEQTEDIPLTYLATLPLSDRCLLCPSPLLNGHSLRDCPTTCVCVFPNKDSTGGMKYSFFTSRIYISCALICLSRVR
jgi:hypothetical protein